MEDIRIQYYYEGNEPNSSGDIFDSSHVKFIADSLQKKYEPFAKRINEQKGYLDLYLSASEFLKDGIHHEAFLMGLSEDFIKEINIWEAAQLT